MKYTENEERLSIQHHEEMKAGALKNGRLGEEEDCRAILKCMKGQCTRNANYPFALRKQWVTEEPLKRQSSEAGWPEVAWEPNSRLWGYYPKLFLC